MRFTVTSSGADPSALTAAAVKALSKANRDVGRDIARVARVAVLADVRASRPGGLSFSGMNTKLGAKAKVEATATSSTVILSARPAGPWSISEHGSRPHEIKPTVKRALYFGGEWSMRADHPGTSGRPYWTGAEPALDRAVFEQVEETFDEALGV